MFLRWGICILIIHQEVKFKLRALIFLMVISRTQRKPKKLLIKMDG
jgi:hypothetical protein